MRKIMMIKKHRDKLVLTENGIEICNITISNSSKHTQVVLSIETNNPYLIIEREEQEHSSARP